MSTNRVTVFSSTNEDNVHTLAGILKSYKITSEIKKLNNSFQITVGEKSQSRAEAIIAKHVRKPGEQKEPVRLFRDFVQENKITSAVLLIAIGVFCFSSFGNDLNKVTKLFMSDVNYQRSVVENNLVEKAVFTKELTELKSGQIWRLFSNAFIHNNLIHFLINLILIFQFGRIIEKTSGLSYLLTLTLVALPLNSYVQYTISESPLFGGLNGLVLTMYGFVLLRSIYDTRYFGKVQNGSYVLMGIWLGIGFFNFFHINMSYGALSGLILGAIWGFLSSRLLPEERLIPPKEGLL